MNIKFYNVLKAVLILLTFSIISACAAKLSVEPPLKPVLLPNNAEPLVHARLGDIRIGPITREMMSDDLKGADYKEISERELKKRLIAFFHSPGLFGTSPDDFINVKADTISVIDREKSIWVMLVEFVVEYEFRTKEGTLLFKEKITSQGTQPGRHQVTGSIGNAVSANLSKLYNAMKQKLPNSWQSYVARRESMQQQIANDLKKENRYFRVISSRAEVRNMPDAKARSITTLAQTELVHITGSLPNGWLQVSREGKFLGWVHSTLVKEDFASSPTYRPEVQTTSSALAMANADIPTDVTVTSFDFGSYHALVVGNNDYRNLPKLNTALNDAQAIATLLQNTYGFNVSVIRNGTRADILRAINGFRRSLTPRDNLLIYYAGHGWLDKDADQGYWLPVDAEQQDPTNWISNSSITDALRAIPAKHVLVIADSCYSGKLARGVHIQIRTKNYYETILNKKARTVMASGGLEPVADEGGKGRHSVFASALIEALDQNRGILDATLLFSQIRRPVMLNTDQTPEYSDIRKAGHDGGDFLFVRKK